MDFPYLCSAAPRHTRPRAIGRVCRSSGRVDLLLGLALGLPLLACAQINSGNSFNPVGSGARAMGEGNAFIAVADDATAASWNPAGLGQLERPEFSVAVDYWDHREKIHSSLHPESQSSSELCDSDLNYWSVVYPFDLLGRNVVASLSYLKLYDMGKSLQFADNYSGFGLDVDQQTSISRQGSLSALAPSLAVNVTDQLSLGLTFNIWNDDITHSSAYQSFERDVITYTDSSGVQHVNTTHLDEYKVTSGYSLAVGALYKLDKCWTLGTVIKPPFTLNLQHKSRQTDQETGDWGDVPLTTTTDTYNDQLNLPLQVGAGVAMHPSDPLTLSMDVTWTQWPTFALHQGDSTYNPINFVNLKDSRGQDTFTVRTGAEYVLPFDHYQMPLRCGLGYDPGPASNEVDEFYTGSLGIGLQWSRYALDAAYELRWGHDVNGATLTNVGSQDVIQHRAMLSLIVYL